MTKRLMRLDDCFQVCRHITAASCEKLLASLASEVAVGEDTTMATSTSLGVSSGDDSKSSMNSLRRGLCTDTDECEDERNIMGCFLDSLGSGGGGAALDRGVAKLMQCQLGH